MLSVVVMGSSEAEAAVEVQVKMLTILTPGTAPVAATEAVDLLRFHGYNEEIIMLKNVAYKVASGIQGLPDGFITESMETDEDVVEGYTVVPHDKISELILKNVSLMQEVSKYHVGVPYSTEAPTPRNVVQAQAADEYQEFLKWKNN